MKNNSKRTSTSPSLMPTSSRQKPEIKRMKAASSLSNRQSSAAAPFSSGDQNSPALPRCCSGKSEAGNHHRPTGGFWDHVAERVGGDHQIVVGNGGGALV